MPSVLHYLIQTQVPAPVSYFDSNFGSLQHVIRLNAYPHAVLTELLSAVCCQAREKGETVHLVHHCLDASLQGVILPESSVGIFGFDPCDPASYSYAADADPENSGAVFDHLQEARKLFLQARTVHDQQERIYMQATDFSALDRITEETIHTLLEGRFSGEPGTETHRFFGAATVNGNLCYIPELTQDLPRRYFIKGRPGTGKSTFLKKVAAAAVQRGCSPEIYHCSLDPKSLDMVILRELGICLFDSTAPHEFFPSRQGDEILDLYALCVAPGTDEANHAELTAMESAYRELVGQGSAQLRAAAAAASRLEAALPVLEGAALQKAVSRLLGQIESYEESAE